MKQFLRLLTSRKISLTILLILVLLSSILESISFTSLPIALRIIINNEEPPIIFGHIEMLKFIDNWIKYIFFQVEPQTAIIRLAILTFFIFFFKFIILSLKDIIVSITEERIIMDLRNNLFSKLLKLPINYINSVSLGSIVSRFTNDVKLLKGAITEGFFEFIFSSVRLIVFMIISFIIAFHLLIVGILIALPLGILLFFISKAMHYRWNKLNENMSKISSYISSTIRGMKVIKIFSNNEKEFNRFKTISENYFRSAVKLEALGSFSTSFSEFIVSIPIILLLIYISDLIFSKGTLSSDQFIVFLLMIISSISPIKRIFRANNHIQRGISTYNRTLAFLRISNEPKGGSKIFNKLESKIEIINLSFSHGSRKILKDINLTINKGEKVAIVGPSGVGKTTLIEIIASLLKPTSGKVLVDGIELWEYNIDIYRGKLAFVPQEPFLFEGTIYENLTLGENIELEKVKYACELANISDFIENLPNGYFYKLTEGGLNVSGGQRQKLTIARAILRNPEIILLDEPTSHIDIESEEKIIKALEDFIVDKTAIIITHRLSLLNFVSKIVVMKDGTILDIGKHQELYNRCEIYRNIVEKQFNLTI
ncbi:MAG: ABC transporter ATP-binding protein/permease [candidate division WOR-3 bacterium]|nr:ABC transporter ATP-binding protein/permease [candidate division WOR-3 bacterium]MCX7948386.1 ABC transporter ATP-binding protein/permease [candidate division WOR-3 bacterium]MDW8151170.1 ABC transporter ATP-binding protein [candidate division WOR-3 bacterium]